jgi:tripartite-type tricarboxylate transporter receptor subunit TctC
VQRDDNLRGGRWKEGTMGLRSPRARRRVLQLAAAAVSWLAFSQLATAQTYPSRPITMILSAPAGGGMDAVARVLAERMRTALGQPIIVENVSGAEGSIGAGRVAHAKPDGYTIELGFLGNHVLNGAFYSLQYDLLNDFASISPVATSVNVLLARKDMPAKDLNELIAWLKANPNKASEGTVASGNRLQAVFFQQQTGTQFALVPYRGTTPAVQDLVAGQIDLLLGTASQLPLIRAGSIKAYAVSSDMRLTLAPDIPTYAEMGMPALSASHWFGLFAPKGMPKDVIGKLNGAAVEALADPAVRSRIGDLGYEVFAREKQTPETLDEMVRTDAAKWWPIIKELGIKAE